MLLSNKITVRYVTVNPREIRGSLDLKGDKKVVIDLRIVLLVKGPTCTNTKATGGE